MASLSAHLNESEMHARLPFHAGCPICRAERLAGTLASGGPISTRAPAALAASVLLLTTAPTALAAENDSEQDGAAPVTQTPGDPSQSPDFDPGGGSDDLPAQAPSLPQTQAPVSDGNDDTGPIDEQPATNPDDPVVDQGDGSDTQPQQPQPTAPATPTNPAPPQTTATTPTAQQQPTATTPPAPTPPTAGSRPAAQHTGPKAHRRHHSHHTPRPVAQQTPKSTATPTPTASPAAPLPSSQPAPTPAVAAVPAAERARPGDQTHTVRRGESLWSIASDFLGRRATPAQIAREVNQLWGLNRKRIGTGNPDLLMTGTTVRLR